MLIPSCRIELSRTVRRSSPCLFVVLGEVSHVTGDGGLRDFPAVTDVIHWNEGRGFIRWNVSSYSECRNIVLSQYSAFINKNYEITNLLQTPSIVSSTQYLADA